MKAKYLFYSLALASAFTACTQEELVEAPALEKNEVANRPVAGVVTFVNDDVESRYNRQDTGFETGDELGLYLMDEFNGIGEENNSNDTYWTWQSCWWNMYNMVNYINSNYGYTYNADTEEWVNRASQLVEGNYIAMFPKNKRATNRQDLWHAIDANVDLVDHTSYPRYYVNRDNQFFVGYEQILRDQKTGEETGELRTNISMKPIMSYAKFELVNEGNFNFKPKKLVFKAHGGEPLPNVAYIKPAGIVAQDAHGCIGPNWSFVGDHAELKKQLKDNCDNLLAWSKYDRSTYNHAAARSLVEYANTTDKIPYGMTDEEAVPTYEYVFNFPADADILYGAIEAEKVGDTKSTLSIALPAFDGWKNMEVVVYGEMQTADDTYVAGILKKREDVDNGVFTLNQLRLWEQGNDIPVSIVNFDHNYFYQQEEIRVATTEDLINLIGARLANVDTSADEITFEVQHYGNGLTITKDVIELIKAYENKNKNVDVTVEFKNSDNVETPIIFATENAIHEFEYSGVNVVVEKPQTITTNVSGILELRNFSTIIVNNTQLSAQNIINEIDATFNANNAVVNGQIHNEGTLALNNSVVNGSISNAATMSTTGNTVVYGFIVNDNACVNCGKDKAVLTIDGTLTAEELTNVDKAVVNGTLNTALVNNGEVIVNGTYNVVNNSVNNGTLTVNESGEVLAVNNALENYGTIYVEGDLMENIKNSGYIYVKKDGHVIVDGIVSGKPAGIIDVTEANSSTPAQAAKDMTGENYFRYTVQAETTSSELKASLEARISENNRKIGQENAIILVWGNESATTFTGEKLDDLNIERVIVNNNLTFVKGTTTTKSTFLNLNNTCNAVDCVSDIYAESKAFVVNGTVTIANSAELILTEEVNVWVDGTLKANNNSNVTGGNYIYGGTTGKVEIDSDVETFTWIRTTLYKGQWYGKSVIAPGLIVDSKIYLVYNAEALATAVAIKNVEDQVIRLAPGTYKSNIILSKQGDVRKTNVTFEPLYEGSSVVIDGQIYMDLMEGNVTFKGLTFTDINTPDETSDYENYNVERMNQAINTMLYSYYPKNEVVFDNCKFNVTKNGVRVYKDWHNHYGGKLSFVNSVVNVNSKVTDPINAIEISGNSDIQDNTFTGNVFAAVTINGGSDNNATKVLNAKNNITNGFVVMMNYVYGCKNWTITVDEDAKCGFDNRTILNENLRNGGNWNLYEE